jgi:hypothetical protein
MARKSQDKRRLYYTRLVKARHGQGKGQESEGKTRESKVRSAKQVKARRQEEDKLLPVSPPESATFQKRFDSVKLGL